MDFLGIGPIELFFIIVIALLVLGPGKMVEAARTLGKFVLEIKRASSELPSLVSLEEEPLEPFSSGEEEGKTQSPRNDNSEERTGEG